MDKILYKSSSLPAMQNVLFANKEDALSSPRADLSLVMDPTGFVFNAAFDPDLVQYNVDYQNDQGYSDAFKKHLLDVIQLCRQFCLNPSSLVVDVGCGKGGFVDLMRLQGINAVGYDNTYEGNSLYIRKSFFNEDAHEYGDLLTLRHVLEHVQNPWVFIRELAVANGKKGFLYVEVPDLHWILKNHAYYDLFHEHVNYFCAEDFARCFSDALCSTFSLFNGQYLGIILDLSLVLDCNDPIIAPQSYHKYLVSSFNSLREHEIIAYDKALSCNNLVIWGGASKGVVFAAKAPKNVSDKFLFAIDINPNKAHKFMPLSGVEVLQPQQGLELLKPDDTVMIVNPNYEEEIVSCLPHDHPYQVLR
tara:strand:- start:15992 stop:17074 length:1083 start_codon:yes stop_codon:yes gene_type:complete